MLKRKTTNERMKAGTYVHFGSSILYITLSKYEEVHDSGLFYCFPSMNKENLSHFRVQAAMQAAGDTDFITRFQLQNQSEQ